MCNLRFNRFYCLWPNGAFYLINLFKYFRENRINSPSSLHRVYKTENQKNKNKIELEFSIN